ncbi:MAG: hypothetical protein ACOCZM_01780 [Bacillota bacterium]
MKLLIFAHKEAIRILRGRYKFTLRIFNRLVFLFLFLGINLYLLRGRGLMSPVSTSGIMLRAISWRKVLFFSLILLTFCVFEFNRRVLHEFFAEYREEIKLIKRLNLGEEVGKIPLMYIVFILNLISSFAAGLLIYTVVTGLFIFTGGDEAISGSKIFIYLSGAGLIFALIGILYTDRNIEEI